MPMTELRATRLTAAMLLGAGVLAAGGVPDAVADPAPVTVTVNARAGMATVPDTALGVNHAIWDAELGTNAVSDLLRDAGVQMMRYPGGSYGDIYHWETHTAPGGFVAPNTDFDTFMGGVRRAGAQAIIIANYGTGTPEEAAGWVRYANITKGYGVKYWEIGNELYGNGHYGSQWEADDHPDKSPTGYATNVVEFATAMKAVDPTIKIGAVLTTPAGWPDSVVADGDPASWNDTVLEIAGPHIDFGILHWYPGGATPAESLTKPEHLTDAIHLVRQQISRHLGPAGSRIGLALTELNVGVGKNTQPGALFAADTYATLLENGVFNIDWWNVHNGIGAVSTVAGHTDYDDWGMLSSATCNADNVCEPALNTPFPPYHALRMLGLFTNPGDQLVRAAADESLVSAHAARRPNGDLAVMLINKDPDAARPVTIDYAGFTPAAEAPTVHSFANGAPAIGTTRTGTPTTQTLPPYSLTTLVLRPSAVATGLPGAPGQPAAGTVTHRDATLSWPAATPGRHPIAKYEVHRQLGAVSEQWGETSGTTFTARNLVPGTRYTVNVLARDTAGNVSWSSPPLTLTTGAPARSTCAVRLSDASNWSSGFVASIDLTNTGATPINGWTLTFTWPTRWQQLANSWNGTWTQTGTTVTATNADFNATLAPGASTNIGFVGNYSGPNVLPTTFTLNGILCSAA